LRTTISPAIIDRPRHHLTILIVARLPSRLSRYRSRRADSHAASHKVEVDRVIRRFVVIAGLDPAIQHPSNKRFSRDLMDARVERSARA